MVIASLPVNECYFVDSTAVLFRVKNSIAKNTNNLSKTGKMRSTN